MKKRIVLILVCMLFLNVFTIFTAISYFTTSDTNYDSFLQIGKLQSNELSLNLYATTGEKFRYRIDIPNPRTNKYDYLTSLRDSLYTTWLNEKNKQIINIINIKNLGRIIPNEDDFISSNDKNFFKHNYISFDANPITGFSSERGFHLFFVIYNNAHLVDNPQKIKLSKDIVNFEATVNFLGETTGRVWRTHYKENIDFNHNKHYVTNAYRYNTGKKTYEQITRGSHAFYNDADLIITDLGITGDIEIKQENWSLKGAFGNVTHAIKEKMLIPTILGKDKNAKVVNASYNVTFIPSENKSKEIINSLYLGE